MNRLYFFILSIVWLSGCAEAKNSDDDSELWFSTLSVGKQIDSLDLPDDYSFSKLTGGVKQLLFQDENDIISVKIKDGIIVELQLIGPSDKVESSLRKFLQLYGNDFGWNEKKADLFGDTVTFYHRKDNEITIFKYKLNIFVKLGMYPRNPSIQVP